MFEPNAHERVRLKTHLHVVKLYILHSSLSGRTCTSLYQLHRSSLLELNQPVYCTSMRRWMLDAQKIEKNRGEGTSSFVIPVPRKKQKINEKIKRFFLLWLDLVPFCRCRLFVVASRVQIFFFGYSDRNRKIEHLWRTASAAPVIFLGDFLFLQF